MLNEVMYQREYLRGRLEQVKQDKKAIARTAFGLDDEEAPKNFKELKERIESGRYVVDEKLDEAIRGCSPLYAVRWRVPELKEDQAGYREFKRKLEKLYERARDDIRIMDVKEGLDAIRTFETATV